MTGLAIRAGSPGAQIVSFGDHRPANVMTNADLEKIVETSDEWIRSRVGIETRRIAAADESMVSMASSAAAKAVASSGIDPLEIDLVLLGSCTLPAPIPSGAPRVATEIGAVNAAALDVNAACSSFCYALAQAADAIRGGSARHVVVVGSEMFSRPFIDWTDRGTCVIFADGAGAVVVTGSEVNGIGPVIWGADGSRADTFEIPEGGYLKMEGQAVYRWAALELKGIAKQACDAAGVTVDELAAFVPHQANLRIVDHIAKDLGIDPAKVARDVINTGNTSAASIPLALARMSNEGLLPSGAPVLLFGYGAGLTYAAQVVTAP
ncbi:MAG: beta-ketoacyl-ACP synthase III [Actinomycetota bacterium]